MVFLCLSARSFFFTESKARALGWSTARRSTYGLNVYLQAVDHTTQRITLYAEILGSSNLIILLLQDCKNEALFELTHRRHCHSCTYAVRDLRAEPSRRILPPLLLVSTRFSR